MTKKKTAYSCQECGAVHFKWAGKCSDCGAWNSLVEEFEEGGAHFSRITKKPDLLGAKGGIKGDASRVKLVEIDGDAQDFARIDTSIKEFNRVLGGGLVKGSVTLIGGNPGIGKSTLLIQTADLLSKKGCDVIYVSGEESVDQVRLRAKRLGIGGKGIRLAASTNVGDILEVCGRGDSCLRGNDKGGGGGSGGASGGRSVAPEIPDQVRDDGGVGGDDGGKPKGEDSRMRGDDGEKGHRVVIVDSIQTMFIEELSSAPGSVAQVRSSASELTNFAKKNNVTLLIVSHVTKDGQIAGPKVLEHVVDTVLYFEGEKDLNFRILRAVKNRFGAAGEIGVFEMNEAGLCEVSNPSELFLASYDRKTSGTAVFAGIEGTRPILVEVQALISPSYMPSPRRAVVGWDSSRLAMVIAVLGARFGLNLSDKEVYLNVVGGIEVKETAADLAIACALVSAARDLAIPESTIIIGEIGLTGEIRMVGNIEDRLKEASRLGFKNCVVPKGNLKGKGFKALAKGLDGVEIKGIGHVREIGEVFG